MDNMLTVNQAAAWAKVHPKTWRTWHKAGRIPAPVRMGRSYLWRAADLQRWQEMAGPDGRPPDRARYELLSQK